MPPAPVQPLEGHTDAVTAIAVAGRRVWTGAANGELKCWRLPDAPSPLSSSNDSIGSQFRRRVQSGNWVALMRVQGMQRTHAHRRALVRSRTTESYETDTDT